MHMTRFLVDDDSLALKALMPSSPVAELGVEARGEAPL
jgi:hypothetical protein